MRPSYLKRSIYLSIKRIDSYSLANRLHLNFFLLDFNSKKVNRFKNLLKRSKHCQESIIQVNDQSIVNEL